MILHLTNDQLEWQSINHHVEFNGADAVNAMLQAEFFYYKNEDVTIRTTINIIEHSNHHQNFEVVIHGYAHIHPESIRMDFSERKQIGEFETMEEAKLAAQTYFNHHRNHRY